MIYVLTKEQFNQALIIGFTQLKILSKSEGEAALANPNNIKLEKAVNGLVLTVAEGSTQTVAAAPTATKGKPGRKPKVATAAPAATPKVTSPGGDDGPLPENVKAALIAAHMERPPGVNSIAAWTPEQRRLAMKWSKDTSKPRPEFIKERAVRGSKGTAVVHTTAVANGTTAPNGNAEHFEDPFAAISE